MPRAGAGWWDVVLCMESYLHQCAHSCSTPRYSTVNSKHNTVTLQDRYSTIAAAGGRAVCVQCRHPVPPGGLVKCSTPYMYGRSLCLDICTVRSKRWNKCINAINATSGMDGINGTNGR